FLQPPKPRPASFSKALPKPSSQSLRANFSAPQSWKRAGARSLPEAPRPAVRDFNVGILIGRAPNFLQNENALGIVRGAAAREGELAIKVPLRDAIRANHSHGVLQPIEARNLRQDRTLRINLIAKEHLGDEFRIQRTIFLGKRVDGRIEKILRNGELAGKFGRREHGSVVARDKLFQKLPDGA